nr:hypothetical protein [uncultured Carboxylicivirga sp.]
MKKKAIFKLSLLVALTIGLYGPLKAQDALTYTKEIKAKTPQEINTAISNLTLTLVEKTNANVCAQCKDKNVVIFKGQIPLTLTNNPYDVAYNFNGYINYQLEVNYNNGIELTFKNLKHESKNSINGFDLNYGQLLSNGSTSKNAVYNNYNFLLEDYRKITLFQTDKDMEKRIQQKVIDNIDELIAEK